MSAATDPLMNPWHPMTDPVDLKHLLKLVEELGEFISATARCGMQGIDELHPVTGKSNREWLEDELADVYANCQLIEERFGVGANPIRIMKKLEQLRSWHSMA